MYMIEHAPGTPVFLDLASETLSWEHVKGPRNEGRKKNCNKTIYLEWDFLEYFWNVLEI